MRACSMVALVFALGLASGCDAGNGEVEEGPLLCVPGESRSCTGPAGCAGGQICNGDGRAYGACVCGGAEEPVGRGQPPPPTTPPAPSPAEEPALEDESREDQCDRLASAIHEIDPPFPNQRLQANADALRARAERVAGLRFGDPNVAELQEIYVDLVKDLANASDKTGDAVDHGKPGEALDATLDVPAYEQRDAAFVERLTEVCGD